MITFLGFTLTSDDRYEFRGDLNILRNGSKKIEKALEPMRVAKMSPQERAKYQQAQEKARIEALNREEALNAARAEYDLLNST